MKQNVRIAKQLIKIAKSITSSNVSSVNLKTWYFYHSSNMIEVWFSFENAKNVKEFTGIIPIEYKDFFVIQHICNKYGYTLNFDRIFAKGVTEFHFYFKQTGGNSNFNENGASDDYDDIDTELIKAGVNKA